MGRVLLTGASSASGQAIAAALAARGDQLVLVGRRPGPLQALAAKTGGRVVPWDVTRDPELLLDIIGPIDHLIHAAGGAPQALVSEWSAETLRGLFEVHALAPAMLARAFAAQAFAEGAFAEGAFAEGAFADALPSSARSGHAVLALGSAAVGAERLGEGPLAAAKAAWHSLTRSLALELAPLRVNTLLPHPTDPARTAALALATLDDLTLTGAILQA